MCGKFVQLSSGVVANEPEFQPVESFSVCLVACWLVVANKPEFQFVESLFSLSSSVLTSGK